MLVRCVDIPVEHISAMFMLLNVQQRAWYLASERDGPLNSGYFSLPLQIFPQQFPIKF
jgi:hypothetical protein